MLVADPVAREGRKIVLVVVFVALLASTRGARQRARSPVRRVDCIVLLL